MIRLFQESLDLLEKPSRDGPIDDAVIGGETHGHYRTHSNAFAVRHDAWTDPADCKNRTLRRIDDGDETIHAEHAKVGNRESTAFVVQRKSFFFRALSASSRLCLCQLLV